MRHDILHIRRTLAPMRDTLRRVTDDVADVDESPEVHWRRTCSQA